MSNIKISALPTWTGTSADIRWFVMNNQGENETYKFSGYSTSITYGTGTNSIKSANAAESSGNSSIAIGNNSKATGDDSICIGNINGETAGYRSVILGRHFQTGGANYQTIIGSGGYITGNFSIAIGHEIAASNSGIAIGSNTTRATGLHSIALGNNNDRGLGSYSAVMGYGNKIGDAPNYDPGSYNNIIASNSIINPTNSSYNYNSIFGGYGNIISGNTSGTTFLGLVNYTAPVRNDATYTQNLVLTNYANLDFSNDSAAAAGGVVLGQVYHNNGSLRIRIS